MDTRNVVKSRIVHFQTAVQVFGEFIYALLPAFICLAARSVCVFTISTVRAKHFYCTHVYR
jgi:hypothetical protein